MSSTILGSFSGVATSVARPYITFSYTQGYDGTPYSTVTATLKFVKYNSSYGSYNNSMPNTSNVNGTTNATDTAFDLRPVGTAPVYDTIRSVVVRVDHATDGTKTCTIGWSGDTETSLGTFNFSSNVTLDTITQVGTATTQAASSVDSTSATANGTVTDDGVPTNSNKGIYWGTASGNLPNQLAVGSGGEGAFTRSMTSLSPGTTYYYKAYTYNGQYSYGSEVNFTTSAVAPTVTTQNCSSVMPTTATGNGNITATGGASVTRRGFCYKAGTSGDPTTSDSTVYDDGTFGTGAYTKGITGLTGATGYRVRAYAVNSVGTSYGTTVQLTTSGVDAPTVTTTTTSLLRRTQVVFGGEVTDIGDAAVTDRGVYLGTTEGTQATKLANGTGIGTYSIHKTGLDPNTLYYYKAYATNSIGTSYGDVLHFTTGNSLSVNDLAAWPPFNKA
jgi:hypothetical protein